jgi:hypothetical protein
VIHGEQVENAPFAGGKSGHLSVDWLAAQGGIESFDFGTRLRLQPRLGVLAVERVQGIGSRLSRAIELFGEARDFRCVMLAGGAARTDSEEEVAAIEFGSMPHAERCVHRV